MPRSGPGSGCHRLAVDEQLAACGLLDAEQHAQERRLAAAGGADDGDELMVGDREIQILEHDLRAVFLPQAV